MWPSLWGIKKTSDKRAPCRELSRNYILILLRKLELKLNDFFIDLLNIDFGNLLIM
jgi:hypothetical protein